MKPVTRTVALTTAALALLIPALPSALKLWRGEPEGAQSTAADNLKPPPPVVEKAEPAPAAAPAKETATSKPDPAELERQAFAYAEGGDVREGMRFFETVVPLERIATAWRGFARRLALEAPEEGFRWLCSLAKSDSTKDAAHAFALTLRGRNSALSRRLLDALAQSGSPLRKPFLSGMIQAETGRSVEGAVRLVHEVGLDDAEKDSLLRNLAGQVARDHNALLELARLAPAQVDSYFVGNALFSLWSGDPAKAQEYLDSISDNETVAQALNPLADKMGKADPEAAERWVNSLPPGDLKDSAMVGFARSLSRDNPLKAIQVALLIEGERSRAAGVSSMILPVVLRQLPEAQELVRASSLTDAEKQKWIDFSNEAAVYWRKQKASSGKPDSAAQDKSD